MTTPTLEDTIRDLAKRGEISHISLTPSQNGKLWRGSFTMCSHFGVSFAEDADPVQALMLAFTSAKLKKPRTKIDLKPSAEPEPETGGVTIDWMTGGAVEPDPLDDLM
jgi:hypothetical protein